VRAVVTVPVLSSEPTDQAVGTTASRTKSVLSANGADGIDDIEGKAAKGSGEGGDGRRASFKSAV
jgi:hypothetical protein